MPKPEKRQTRSQLNKKDKMQEESDSESISSEQFLQEEWSTDIETHIFKPKFE